MKHIILARTIAEDVGMVLEQIPDELKRLDGSALLLSGGAGFIGAYMLDVLAEANEKLLRKPCTIYCYDTLITGTTDRIRHLARNPWVRFRKQDISLPLRTRKRFGYIVHAAGIASPMYYREHPVETMEAAVGGVWNLLEYARAHQSSLHSMLFLSSSEVYGDPDEGHIPTSEEYAGRVSFTGPRACYDESKRFGETLCVSYRNRFGLPIKIARPGNVYGPGMRLDDKRVIPDLMADALHNRDLVLLSDGSPTRCFCYVTDAIIGFFKLLLSDRNSEYNISNDAQEVSMRDLAQEVAGAAATRAISVTFGQSNDRHYLTDNPHRRHLNIDKARNELGYAPRIGLHEGLKRTAAWYRESTGAV